MIRHDPLRYSKHVYPPDPFAAPFFQSDPAGLGSKERKALLRLARTQSGMERREVEECVVDGVPMLHAVNREVFEFLDLSTGFRYLFDIRGIADAIAEGSIPFHVGWVDIPFSAYLTFLKNGSVEEDHVRRITKKHLEKPPIYIEWPDKDWVLIDGVHRTTWQFRNGIIRQRCILLKPPAWQGFLIDQSVTMTDAQGNIIPRVGEHGPRVLA